MIRRLLKPWGLGALVGIATLGLGIAAPARAVTVNISWSSTIYSNTAGNILFGYRTTPLGNPPPNEAIQFDYNTGGFYYLSDVHVVLPATAKFDLGVAPTSYETQTASGTDAFFVNTFTSHVLDVSFPLHSIEEGLANDGGLNVRIDNAAGKEMLGPNPFNLGNGTGNGVDTKIINGATITLTFSTRPFIVGPSPLLSSNVFSNPGKTPPGTSSTGNSLQTQATIVPEGGSLALFGLGVCGSLLGFRRRRA